MCEREGEKEIMLAHMIDDYINAKNMRKKSKELENFRIVCCGKLLLIVDRCLAGLLSVKVQDRRGCPDRREQGRKWTVPAGFRRGAHRERPAALAQF